MCIKGVGSVRVFVLLEIKKLQINTNETLGIHQFSYRSIGISLFDDFLKVGRKILKTKIFCKT